MKLHHIAIAAVCAAAGSSTFAADFYLSGSSALGKVVANAIGNNCSTLVTYKGKLGTAAAGPLDNADGQAEVRYVCTAASPNQFGVPAGTVFNIYENTQGSAFGVFPVANNAGVAFIDPTSCDSGTLLCSGTVSHPADAGLSDLEPSMFNDASNHPVNAFANAPVGTVFSKLFLGQTVSPASFGISKVVALQTFGVAVNQALLNAMQADQGLTVTAAGVVPTVAQTPSVSSSALTTIYYPGYGLASTGWAPFFPNGGGAQTNQVNICSRLPGSGTLATAQAFFLQAPYSKFAQSFGVASTENTNDTTFLSDSVGQNNLGGYAIGEYDNSGAVTGCVKNSAGYAVGLLSTDRAQGGTNGYFFINLDGSVPTAAAVRVGKYQWAYEAYYQTNKASTNPIAGAFFTELSKQSNIAALAAASLNGISTAVANCPVATAATCSHVTRGGDARAALIYAQ